MFNKLLFIIVIIIFSSCNDEKPVKKVTKENTKEKKAIKEKLPLCFFNNYEGTIDGEKATIFLLNF